MRYGGWLEESAASLEVMSFLGFGLLMLRWTVLHAPFKGGLPWAEDGWGLRRAYGGSHVTERL